MCFCLSDDWGVCDAKNAADEIGGGRPRMSGNGAGESSCPQRAQIAFDVEGRKWSSASQVMNIR